MHTRTTVHLLLPSEGLVVRGSSYSSCSAWSPWGVGEVAVFALFLFFLCTTLYFDTATREMREFVPDCCARQRK